MNRTEQVILTNMCMVYDDNGNVLVQNRVSSFWSGVTFPGGHVERGESFTDAVIREVLEETGLTVKDLQLCGIKDWSNEDGTRYIVLCYKTNRFEGELCSSDEGEVWWVPLDELPKMELAEDMDSMLQLFCNDSISEMFFLKEAETWISVLK